MGTVSGSLSNPLLVVPIKPATTTEFPSVQQPVESARLNSLVGTGYKAYEDSILEKLQKVRLL